MEEDAAARVWDAHDYQSRLRLVQQAADGRLARGHARRRRRHGHDHRIGDGRLRQQPAGGLELQVLRVLRAVHAAPEVGSAVQDGPHPGRDRRVFARCEDSQEGCFGEDASHF